MKVHFEILKDEGGGSGIRQRYYDIFRGRGLDVKWHADVGYYVERYFDDGFDKKMYRVAGLWRVCTNGMKERIKMSDLRLKKDGLYEIELERIERG